jgi:NAD(P) transhydrogenase
LLPFLDDEIAQLLQRHMLEPGIDLRLNEDATHIDRHGASVHAGLRSGAEVHAEAVLFAGGRIGNTESLGLDALGIEMDRKGRIKVNDRYHTAVPNVMAAGDVIGFPALAATSMEQGRVAVCHAFGFEYKTRVSSLIPYAVYTIPEVSMVGVTEEQLREQGRRYSTGRGYYRWNARGQIMGDIGGLVKLVFDRDTQELLGVHIIGERASELIHIGQACMYFNGTIDFFIQNVFNFPTLSDVYKYAAYDGLGNIQRASG